MQVFVGSGEGELAKFRGVVSAFADIWSGAVLDVGCRSGNLRTVLPDQGIRYTGVDLYPPADVIGNVEKGLPFADRSFDVVVALDVLEHTNDLHQAFDELCRLSQRYVVISLPNVYEASVRWRFLRGRPLSGKYGLPLESQEDRHRWLFSLDDASAFMRGRASRCGFEVVAEGALTGPRRAALAGPLLRWFPNLLAQTHLCLLRRVAD